MNYSTLSFLAQLAFVVPLYAIIALIAVWVIYERFTFPRRNDIPKKVAYYVAGEGFGIVLAMLVARAVELGFWQEFWLECVMGSLSGWLVFRYPALRHAGYRRPLSHAVWLELPTIVPVMAGVGIVTGAVMPRVIGEQPPPNTPGFWGFAGFALLLGFVVAWPVNKLLEALGSGMNPRPAAQVSRSPGKRFTIVGVVTAYLSMAWLAMGVLIGSRTWCSAEFMPTLGAPWSETRLRTGLEVDAALALASLESGDRAAAVAAIEAGSLLASAIDNAANTACSRATLSWFQEIKQRLQRGNAEGAKDALSHPRVAFKKCPLKLDVTRVANAELVKYVGAAVIDAFGNPVGEITDVRANEAELGIGGAHDIFGVIDVGVKRRVVIRRESLVLGPSRRVGARYVVAPGLNPRLLRACADPNNLPFSNDRGEGFENKLAELMARTLKAELSYVWWPERRGFLRNTLNAHECDVVMGLPTGSERVLTTAPVYRSGYAMLAPASGPHIGSLNDPRLQSMRIGVPLVGDDGANPPPVEALVRRNLGKNLRGYLVYGDYGKESPPSELVRAVSHGEVDVAIAWGPLAGYYAKREKPPLNLILLDPAEAPERMPFSFQISMAVRRGDNELLMELNQFILEHSPEIHALLAEYGVPAT